MPADPAGAGQTTMIVRHAACFVLLFGLLFPVTAAAVPPAKDILYFDWEAAGPGGVPADTTLDQLAAVEAVVDQKQRGRLFVGRLHSGKTTLFAVLYRVPGEGATGRVLAKRHQDKLSAAVGAQESLTRLIPRTSYRTVFNISYGLGKNFEALKKNWALVARVLGPKLAKRLYVEQTDRGNYALVYKRYGTSRASRDVARVHKKLLRRHRVGASLIKERNNRIVWDGAGSPEPDDERPTPSKQAAAAADADRPQENPADAGKQAPAKVDPPQSEAVDTDKQAPAKVAAALGAKSTGSLSKVLILKGKKSNFAKVPGSKQAPASPTGSSPRPKTASTKQPRKRALVDGGSSLERKIELLVKGLRQRSRVSAVEHTSWLVYDLHRDVTLASINAETPRQAASMIKPLVMLAYFHRVKQKRLPYRGIHRARLAAMIQHSSNTATDWFIRLLGGPRKVHALLKRHYGKLLRQTSVVEYIGRAGQTYRNRASAADYGRFLRALWRNKLPHAAKMRRFMNLPGRDRLFHGARHVPSGTVVYNKTGTTAKLCGDMGLLVARRVNGGKLPYIVVGIVERPTRTQRYFRWVGIRGDVIRRVSDTAYLHLKKRYALR